MLEHQFGFDVRQIIDFTEFESHNKFLEGTGSIVLDRVSRKAYAALSDRTDARALEHFCDQLDFEPVAFQAFQTVDNQRLPIYHTNVMMSIGSGYAVVCLDCIDSDDERKQVVDAIAQDGLQLIAITEEQVNQFAGNMLELTGDEGPVLVMSASAYQSLVPGRLKNSSSTHHVLHAPLPTIETCGGGSARCMIAKSFTQAKRLNHGCIGPAPRAIGCNRMRSLFRSEITPEQFNFSARPAKNLTATAPWWCSHPNPPFQILTRSNRHSDRRMVGGQR